MPSALKAEREADERLHVESRRTTYQRRGARLANAAPIERQGEGGPSWIRTRDDTGYEPGALTAELRARAGDGSGRAPARRAVPARVW